MFFPFPSPMCSQPWPHYAHILVPSLLVINTSIAYVALGTTKVWSFLREGKVAFIFCFTKIYSENRYSHPWRPVTFIQLNLHPPWSCPQPFPSRPNPTSTYVVSIFWVRCLFGKPLKEFPLPAIDVCLDVMYVVCWSLLRRRFSPSLIEKGFSNWKKDSGIIIVVLGVPFHGRWSRYHISFSLTPGSLQPFVSLFCTVSRLILISHWKYAFVHKEVLIGGPFWGGASRVYQS